MKRAFIIAVCFLIAGCGGADDGWGVADQVSNSSQPLAPLPAEPTPPANSDAPTVAIPETPSTSIKTATAPSASAMMPAQAPDISIPETPSSRAAIAGALPKSDYQTHCKGVARQRADDALANGFDRTTMDAIYEGALQQCLEWSSAHGGE